MRCTCRSSPQPRRAARDIAALDVGLADVSEVRAVQPTEASLRTGVVAVMPPGRLERASRQGPRRPVGWLGRPRYGNPDPA